MPKTKTAPEAGSSPEVGPPPQARYPLRVQAMRSSGQNTRFFVYIPMPLAAALGISGGEQVEWRLLARDELRLIRTAALAPKKTKADANMKRP